MVLWFCQGNVGYGLYLKILLDKKEGGGFGYPLLDL